MSFRSPATIAISLIVLLLVCGTAKAQPTRFTAQFASGKRLAGSEIRNWHDSQAEPHLDSTRLWSPEDRALWIDDTTLLPAVDPPTCVEFFGGDRLPGRVVEYRTGAESQLSRIPPCLVVVPTAAVDWPDAPRPFGISVTTRWLRRVVWQRRDDTRYRPGTLFYSDGRQVEYRSVRWQKNSVKILVDQESREVPFSQIAELHLPRLDPWDAWFHQLAALAPDLTGLLMQAETADGLRITTSMKRTFPTFRGDGGNPDHWYQALQPFWSVEPLWLRHRLVRCRRFFLPHEVPLTAIEPQRSVVRSTLSGKWQWQRDRNVHSLPLRSADQLWGWGYGVHAYSEMTFEMPACVKSFRTQYGLDNGVGTGGCVRALVIAGPVNGTVIHRSEHVIGSAKSYDSSMLGLAGQKQLTLVVDPAQDDRPAGADPFEIRDSFAWLQPVIELDLEPLRAEIARRVDSPIWGWTGWILADLPGKPAVVSHSWLPLGAPQTRYRVEIAPQEGFLSIGRKKVEVRATDKYLAVAVSRLEKETSPSRLQVRLAGRSVAEFDVPVQNSPVAPDPLLVPLNRYRGQTVDIELVQYSAAPPGQSPPARIEWRGAGILSGDPTGWELMDDNFPLARSLTEGAGVAAFDVRERISGAASLEITGEDCGNAAIPGWSFPIRAEPGPGEYRYLRFAWKKRGGKEIGLHLARAGAFGEAGDINPRDSFRYHTGRKDEKDYGRSIQFRETPPDQWEVVTRDLWADFGPFDLTGLRFVCGDGERAWFDQIYLGRSPGELDRAVGRFNQPLPPILWNSFPFDLQFAVEQAVLNPLEFGAALAPVAPQFSTLATADGIWLFRLYRGKEGVVRTHPPAQNQPCVLRAPVRVPAGKRAELKLTVGHHPGANWQLVVLANGERLHDSLIAAETTKDGWADFTIDLSKFAGHNVNLEVQNHANDWSNEYAYWHKVDVLFP
jgi:hypothetical protein